MKGSIHVRKAEWMVGWTSGYVEAKRETAKDGKIKNNEGERE